MREQINITRKLSSATVKESSAVKSIVRTFVLYVHTHTARVYARINFTGMNLYARLKLAVGSPGAAAGERVRERGPVH